MKLFKPQRMALKAAAVQSTQNNSQRYYLNYDEVRNFWAYQGGYGVNLTTVNGEDKTEDYVVIFGLGKDGYRPSTAMAPVPWPTDGSANYELAYCAQAGTSAEISSSAGEYYVRSPLATYTGDHVIESLKTQLNFIVRNCYPFISAAEMTRRINNYYGESETYTEQELLTAAQATIWQYTGADIHSYCPSNRYGLWTLMSYTQTHQPMSQLIPDASNTAKMNKVMAFLESGTSEFGDLEIEDVRMRGDPVRKPNGEYSADIELTFNREVTESDSASIEIICDDRTIDIKPLLTSDRTYVYHYDPIDPTTTSFSAVIKYTKVNYLQTFVYDSVGYSPASQRMIGTGWETTDFSISITHPLYRESDHRFKSVYISKQWLDENDNFANNLHDGNHVTVRLFANGLEFGDAVTIDSSTGWEYTFDKLPFSDISGHEIFYTVKEVNKVGYSGSYARLPDTVISETDEDGNTIDKTVSSFIISNKPTSTVTFTAKKLWDDSDSADRPEEIKLILMQNGQRFLTENSPATLSADNNWFVRWNNLPAKDHDGNDYQYSVLERRVDGYDVICGDSSGSYTLSGKYYATPVTEFIDGGKYILRSSNGDLAFNDGDDKLRWVGEGSDLSELDADSHCVFTAAVNGNGFTLTNEQTGRVLSYNGSKGSRFAGTPLSNLRGNYDVQIIDGNKIRVGTNHYFNQIQIASSYGTRVSSASSARTSFTFLQLEQYQPGDHSIVTNHLAETPISVEVSKTDFDTGAAVSGAHFALYEESPIGTRIIPGTTDDGNAALGFLIDSWTTDSSPHIVYDILRSRSYQLVELASPDGYTKLTENITFDVDEFGSVTNVSGLPTKQDTDGNEISLYTADSINVPNRAAGGITIPETGSVKMKILLGVSASLIAIAAAGLVIEHRRKQKKTK